MFSSCSSVCAYVRACVRPGGGIIRQACCRLVVSRASASAYSSFTVTEFVTMSIVVLFEQTK